VAQQIKLSGCWTIGHFTVKSGKKAFLIVKWPLVCYYQMVNWILVELENDFFWFLVIVFFKKNVLFFFSIENQFGFHFFLHYE
jgi:hypothetical protein